MSEHTPSTDEIREVWGRHSRYMEFDDWLAQSKAEAWDEGFAEGLGDGCSCDGCLKWVSNPYRELGKSGNDFQAKVGIEETE